MIGHMPDLSLDEPDDEAALVERLRRYCARTGKRITVVFDRGLPGGKSRLSGGGVTVVFASERSSADAVILARICKSKHPGDIWVVTSDRELASGVIANHAHVIPSDEFAERLGPDGGTAGDTGNDDCDDDLRPDHLSPEEVEEWLRMFAKRRRNGR